MADSWTEDHARRLCWRAGFGATTEEAGRWAAAGQNATIRNLFEANAALVGPAPTVDGKPIDPVNEWGHDALWWLDRMVRTTKPLEEKITLFWHDHFATAGQDPPTMLAQNRMLRARGLGSFRKLLGAVMRDPAMQNFLSLADSPKEAPNENFARELMELFTLGGGYTERDVREAARALTGYHALWGNTGLDGVSFDRARHDGGVKTIFGRKGRFGPDDVLDMVVAHPRHAEFLVRKLWSFFITKPPTPATVRDLKRIYRGSGLRIAAVVEAILRHPALYADLGAPAMVKCPAVYVAGLLRTAGKGVTADYAWLMEQMGQQLFNPPSVAGWDWGPAWLSSSQLKARVDLVNMMLGGWEDPGVLRVASESGAPDADAGAHVAQALDALGRPAISETTRSVLTDLAGGFFADLKPPQQDKPRQDRADQLQQLLRNLILTGPDAHLH